MNNLFVKIEDAVVAFINKFENRSEEIIEKYGNKPAQRGRGL